MTLQWPLKIAFYEINSHYQPQLDWCHEILAHSASDVKWGDYQSRLKRSLFLIFHRFPSKTLDKNMVACVKEQPEKGKEQ